MSLVTRSPTEAKVGGRLVYAIGDVHGRYDLFRELLAAISRDAAAVGTDKRPVLIGIGDYVNRGPDSAKVLEALVALRAADWFELRLLRGNHEVMLLSFCDEPEGSRDWLEKDGAATLRSYGIRPPGPEESDASLRDARDRLLDAMPASHLHLLQSLGLMVRIGDYAFVHAGIRPGVPLDRQKADDLLWIKQPFLASQARHEKIIVHGHSWTSDKPTVAASRIGIDTGAWKTGVLTAVRLCDGEIGFMQARATDAHQG